MKNISIHTDLKERVTKRIHKCIKDFHLEPSLFLKIDRESVINKLLINIPDNIKDYDVDHIIPLNQFDLTKDDDFITAFCPENHQWLLKIDHLKKTAKERANIKFRRYIYDVVQRGKYSKNFGMTPEEFYHLKRRVYIYQIIKANPMEAYRTIGAAFGLDHKTIASDYKYIIEHLDMLNTIIPDVPNYMKKDLKIMSLNLDKIPKFKLPKEQVIDAIIRVKLQEPDKSWRSIARRFNIDHKTAKSYFNKNVRMNELSEDDN